MPTKIAVVTMRIIPSVHYGREFVAEPGIEIFLESLGLRSVFVTPQQLVDKELFFKLRPEMILLSGGGDLSVVSENPESAYRDDFERSLLELSNLFDIPTLGICRGFQLLNVFEGGAVSRLENHVKTLHEVTIALDDESTETIFVNSFHSFGIRPSDLASGYEVLATAQDGTIEAAAHKEKPFMGFMWHPERNAGQHELAREMVIRKLFKGV